MYGLIKFLFFVVFLFGIDGKISDQRLCGDPTCSEPVSFGKTLLRYVSDDARILSFSSNVDAKIFSKSAGIRDDLWGVEIGGKRGYAPQAMLREYKILKKTLKYVIATESEENTNPTPDLVNSVNVAPDVDPLPVPISGVSAQQIVPDTAPLPAEIRRPYEVHDGTTFYYTPSGNDDLPPPPIHASTTDTNLKASAVDTVPVQVDEPNAAMVLPSPATSSSQDESLDAVSEGDKESSKGIYNYISSFLPGDGSGSKESVQETTEDYEDDDDYEDDEEGSSEELEKFNEETQKLDQNIEVDILNTMNDSMEKMDSIEVVGEEVPDIGLLPEMEAAASAMEDNTNAPPMEAQVAEDNVNTIEATVSEMSDISGEVSITEAVNNTVEEPDESHDAEEVAQVVDNSQLNNVVSDVESEQSEVAQISGNDSDASNVEVVPNREAKVISENVNIMNYNSELIETHPPSIESSSNGDTEIPAVDHSPSVDVEVNINSQPDLVYEAIDQNSVESATTESSNEGTEKLPENSIDEVNIKPEPPSRSIFDLILNRDSTLDEVAEEPPPTGGPEVEQGDVEQATVVAVEEPSASDNNTDAETPTSNTPEELDTSLDKSSSTVINNSVDETEQSDSTYLLDNDPPGAVVEAEDGIFSGLTSFLSSIPSVLTSWPSPAIPSEDVRPDETDPLAAQPGASHVAHETESLATQPGASHAAHETESLAAQPGASHVAHETDQPADTLSVAHQPASNIGETSERVSSTEPSHTHTILPSLSQIVDDISAMPNMENNGPAVSLLITAVTVLLFLLGYYFIEKSRRDSTFIAKINSLERTLFISTKECQLLKDDLDTTKGMLTDEHSSLANNETLTDELYAELEERRAAAVDLEDQIRTLQQELDAATDAGLEVNRMLTEVLAQNGTTNSLFESFESLQAQLKSQQTTIINMSEQLQAKTKEILILEAKVLEIEEKRVSLMSNVEILNLSLNNLLLDRCETDSASDLEHKALLAQIEEFKVKEDAQVEMYHRRINFLEEQLEESESTLGVRESEVETLKACLIAVKQDGSGKHSFGPDEIQALLDVGLARAEVAAAEHDMTVLVDKLREEQGARDILQDHNRRLEEELQSMQVLYTVAESNATQANNKLQVLTKYFAEKEASWQKDLGAKESQSRRSTGEAMNAQETVTLLTKQNQETLLQNELLRNEILEQERQRKEFVKAMEVKYNDAWLSARQFERKLEEARLESAKLRNLLTAADRATNSDLATAAQPANSNEGASRLGVDTNGDLPTSPLHMGHADLPIFPSFVSPHLGGAVGAIPFMPPPSFPQDRRPPPLGCMSSPPLLPPPPPGHYPRHYDRHSPDRHSPDRPLYRGGRPAGFRPLPPTTNKSKGSYPGSSHSSESLDQQD